MDSFQQEFLLLLFLDHLNCTRIADRINYKQLRAIRSLSLFHISIRCGSACLIIGLWWNVCKFPNKLKNLDKVKSLSAIFCAMPQISLFLFSPLTRCGFIFIMVQLQLFVHTQFCDVHVCVSTVMFFSSKQWLLFWDERKCSYCSWHFAAIFLRYCTSKYA